MELFSGKNYKVNKLQVGDVSVVSVRNDSRTFVDKSSTDIRSLSDVYQLADEWKQMARVKADMRKSRIKKWSLVLGTCILVLCFSVFILYWYGFFSSPQAAEELIKELTIAVIGSLVTSLFSILMGVASAKELCTPSSNELNQDNRMSAVKLRASELGYYGKSWRKILKTKDANRQEDN